MNYKPRITADPTYLQAIGQAFYNFTYLEWIVIYTIVKLSADGFDSVPKGQTARFIAKGLDRAISRATPPLSTQLRQGLVRFASDYRAAISIRNKLLHAHPYTALGGAQQITGDGHKWPIDEVNRAAKQFEDAAIHGNGIFHGPLKLERP